MFSFRERLVGVLDTTSLQRLLQLVTLGSVLEEEIMEENTLDRMHTFLI